MKDAGQLDLLTAEFERAAARAGGVVDRGFSVAGRRVEVRFAGIALADDISPAFACPAKGSVDLVILASSGGDPPVPQGSVTMTAPWAMPRHWLEVRTDSGGTPEVVRGLVSSNAAVHWTTESPPLPLYHRSVPFFPVIHHWLSGSDLQLVHAGGVAWRGDGLLIVGPSGAGKSTTALVCACSGFDYAGDDHVVVDVAALSVHALFRSAKVGWDHLPRLSHMVPTPVNGCSPDGPVRDEKALFFVENGISDSGVPLRAIVVPSVAPGSPTSLAPVARRRALAALAPSTILQLGSGQEALNGLRRVCSSLPAYELRLGTDVEAVPALLRELLAQ